MAQVCDRLGVDVWEVIDAAATKPFGYMRFTPGPGLGGHCIPLDPHYLAWKMRTLHYKTRMIGVADEINSEMPAFWVRKVQDALNDRSIALKGARVLVLGVAYKKDIDDMRESPAHEIMDLLSQKGAAVSYHDPYCPQIIDDGHTGIRGLPLFSERLTPQTVSEADVVLVVTDHSNVDYQMVVDNARAVVDTRGVTRNKRGKARVIGLSGQRPEPSRGTPVPA
jgi:UDP-N-acetyl-D-glucosamine dehydrogenase